MDPQSATSFDCVLEARAMPIIQLLAVHASNIGSSRTNILSKWTYYQTTHRARLSDELLQTLVFLKCNAKQ